VSPVLLLKPRPGLGPEQSPLPCCTEEASEAEAVDTTPTPRSTTISKTYDPGAAVRDLEVRLNWNGPIELTFECNQFLSSEPGDNIRLVGHRGGADTCDFEITNKAEHVERDRIQTSEGYTVMGYQRVTTSIEAKALPAGGGGYRKISFWIDLQYLSIRWAEV
jgi:hypothetical protein